MSTTAHVFASIVALASVLFIVRFLRQGVLRAKYAMLWLSIGAAIVVLALSPAVLDRVSRFVGIAYPPTTLFLLSVALLLLLSVHFSYELSRLEAHVRSLAEELALRDAPGPADPTPSRDSDREPA